jgi:hypothetical protein
MLEVRALLVVPLLAAAILAAGCGGGDSSSTTGSSTGSSATSAGDWANSVCEAFTTWTTAITSAGQSVKDNPTEDGLRSAGDDIKSATQTLSDELKGLGRPDTESGQQAKDTVDQLATKLDANQQKIQTAIDNASGTSGALATVSTVSATLVTMGNDLRTTFQQLDQIDGQGELADAFQQSDACAGVTTTS